MIILGGGIAGTSIARELSKYELNLALIERNNGIGLGSTSTNMRLICQGGDGTSFRPGTLHAELNIKSIPEWPKIVEELNIPFKRIGGLSLIRNSWDFSKTMKSISRSFRSSLEKNAPYYISEKEFKPLQLIDRKALYDMEPNLVDRFLGGVYDPNLAVTSSVEVARAFAENAKANGVEIYLETEVQSVDKEENIFVIHTNKGEFRARYVINATGIYSDKIAEMAGTRTFSFVPVKGVMLLLDKEIGGLIRHTMVILPYLEEAPVTKALVPTIDGRVILGIHLELAVKGDLSYDDRAIQHLLDIGREFIGDSLTEDNIEEVIVGQMPFTNIETGWYEYVVESHLRIPNWINIILGPAGVSASPALAKKVAWQLGLSGLNLNLKKDFDPYRRVMVR